MLVFTLVVGTMVPKLNGGREMSKYKYEVTFYVYDKVLNKEFRNVELHRSKADYELRALALNWTVESVKEI